MDRFPDRIATAAERAKASGGRFSAWAGSCHGRDGALVVPPDSGECVAAIELVKSLPLEGAVVTGDAIFTAKPLVEAIRERGGAYFLFVKGNQPELRSELKRAFGDVPPSRDRRRNARVRVGRAA